MTGVNPSETAQVPLRIGPRHLLTLRVSEITRFGVKHQDVQRAICEGMPARVAVALPAEETVVEPGRLLWSVKLVVADADMKRRCAHDGLEEPEE